MLNFDYGPPVCPAYDPVVLSDVSVDPLGTALVYERLAHRLLPGMTVRMTRPRFLTALAVGAFQVLARRESPDSRVSES